MSLRKIAALLAAAGLAVGLIGGGVGANFTDQVQAIQHINVGTFSCIISASGAGVTLGDYQNGYPHSVTYSDPTPINSSAPSSAPFSFTVQNNGSIDALLTITASSVSDPFSIINSPFSSVPLSAGNSQPISTGISWGPLNNSNLGQTVTATWTVECSDAGTGAVIFDNTPPVNGFYSPARYYSESLGADSYTQFGTQVGFAGSARNLQTVTVAMSSWACQSGSWVDGTCVTTPGATFNVPITFNIYAVGTGNTVGAPLSNGSVTHTFAIPYRPSAVASCPASGQAKVGAMFRDSAGDCQNGFVSEITFAFSGVTLPDNAIFGISYPTTGDAGSLNVMLYPSDSDTPVATQPAVGTFPLPDKAYTASPSPFQLDANHWGGIQPAVQFTAN